MVASTSDKPTTMEGQPTINTTKAQVIGTMPSLEKGKRKRDTGPRKGSTVWDHFTKGTKTSRAYYNYCRMDYASDSKVRH